MYYHKEEIELYLGMYYHKEEMEHYQGMYYHEIEHYLGMYFLMTCKYAVDLVGF
jgi:hypothetical protein